ncbi:MAG: hypothetical protein V4726_10240 [Verrucomicrobiota bacterium]
MSSLGFLTEVPAEIPPNDDFANAIALPGTNPAEGSGSNMEATTANGEWPDAVWWTWTAPASGTAFADTAGSSFQTAVLVFTGGSLATATKIASDATFLDTYKIQRKTEWQATAGETYHIAVGSYNSSRGAIRLTAGVGPRPVNDTRAAAVVLPGMGSLHVQGSTAGAFNAGTESPDKAVWWSWTAPAAGIVEVDVSRSSFPARAGIYLTSPPGGPPVDPAKHGDWIIGSPQPVCRFMAEAGAVYAIAAGGGQGELRGLIDLRLTQFPPETTAPANDSLSRPAEITTLGFAYAGDTTSASAEALPFPSSRQNHTVWHRWTAPAAGAYGVMFRKPLFHPYCITKLYTGRTPAELRAVTMGIGIYSRLGSASFQAAAGDVFYLETGSYSGEDCGAFSIEIQSAPANDAFARAVDLGSAASAAVDGTNIGSTLEDREPHFLRMRSVWYQWKAPSSGTVTLAASSREADRINPPVAAVYTGTTVTSLSRVLLVPSAPGNLLPAFAFEAVAGQVYKIAVLNGVGSVKHAQQGDGKFTLRLTMGNFGSPYSVWLLSWPELQGDSAGRLADPDGDGWCNLQELAFEGSPLVREDTSLLLERNFESQPPGIRFYWRNFVFLKGSGYGQPLVISPEVSTDGIHWSPPLPGEYNVDTSSVALPFSRSPRTLTRLRVTDANLP